MNTPYPKQRKSETALDRAPIEVLFEEGKGLSFEMDEVDGAEVFVLRLAKGKRLDTPVLVKFKEAASDAEVALTLIVHAQEGAQLTVVEDASSHVSGRVNFRRKLIAEKHAKIRYASLQASQAEHWREYTDTEVREEAHLHFSGFHFGAKSVDGKVTQNVTGRAGRIDTDIATRRQGSEGLNMACVHHFDAPDGAGETWMNGVALDSAELIFDGMIKISKNGGGTDSFLGEAILNLSEKTRVGASPGLEIDTNDVKAGHSAAVHNLSDEDLIYLVSRGLPKEQARNMMINGFLRSAMDKVKDIPAMHASVAEVAQ